MRHLADLKQRLMSINAHYWNMSAENVYTEAINAAVINLADEGINHEN